MDSVDDRETGPLQAREVWDAIEERRVVDAIRASMFGDTPQQTRVSRYILYEPIAQGAMGVVYRATDPLLGRDVAVKLIRTREGDTSSAHARLLAEAKAIAGVAHPNVIEVFDTGDFDVAEVFGDGHGRGVFIVLALVQGPTLHEWLAQRPRGWRAVLPPIIAAGRGLSAVHRAGLVHRDFKPANVLFGDPIRIADFGLAAASDDGTGTRVVAGTPGYMAPEQHEGRFDARSDQYALGATLWRALYDRAPPRAESALDDPSTLPRLRAPPNSKVPRWLHAVVARAMHPDPEQRYPDVDALLRALGRDPARRAIVVGGLVASVAAAAVMGFSLGRPTDPRCGGDAFANSWNDEARTEIRRQFLASDLEFSGAAFAGLAAGVDGFVSSWTLQRDHVCRLPDGAARERGLECLGGQRDRMEGLLGVFATADTLMVERASTAVDQFPRPLECEQIDPGLKEQSARLSAPVERAWAMFELGRNRDARELAVATLEAAKDPIAVAELELLLCRIDADEAADVSGSDQCRRALLAAERALHPSAAIRALTAQAALNARTGHLDAGWEALTLAEAKLAAGPLPGRLELACQRVRATLTSEVDLELAVAQMEQHIADLEEYYGPDSTISVPARVNLAIWLRDLGAMDRARMEYQSVLALIETRLGSQHPHLAAALNNVGALEHAAGNYVRSEALLQRSLAIKRATPGWDTQRAASTLRNLADLHDGLGDFQTAEREAREALALLNTSGAVGRAVTDVRTVLARILRHSDRLEESLVEAVAASDGTDQGRRSEDRVASDTRVELARVSVALGDPHRARGLLLEALAEHDDRVRPNDTRGAWVGMALVESALGDSGRSLDALDEAEHAQRRSGQYPAEWAGDGAQLADAIELFAPQRAQALRAEARRLWTRYAPGHPGLRRLGGD